MTLIEFPMWKINASHWSNNPTDVDSYFCYFSHIWLMSISTNELLLGYYGGGNLFLKHAKVFWMWWWRSSQAGQKFCCRSQLKFPGALVDFQSNYFMFCHWERRYGHLPGSRTLNLKDFALFPEIVPVFFRNDSGIWPEKHRKQTGKKAKTFYGKKAESFKFPSLLFGPRLKES